jgi:hypothetical protein
MGPFLKLQCAHSPLNLRILSSTSVPFTLTTVQEPNLALTHMKRITVHASILALNFLTITRSNVLTSTSLQNFKISNLWDMKEVM